MFVCVFPLLSPFDDNKDTAFFRHIRKIFAYITKQFLTTT